MESHDQPLISIVIPSSGVSSSLLSCLESCESLRRDFFVEIILSFDKRASLKSLEAIYKRFPQCRILFSPEAGASYARNFGLKSITGKYFLLIDDDCIVGDKVWLKNLLEKSRSRHLHGGHYHLADHASYWARVYNWVNDCWLEFGKTSSDHCEHLLGGFMFGHSEVGLKMEFDPCLAWGGEEIDLIRRNKENFQISAKLHGDLRIRHQDPSGFRKFVKRSVLQGFAAGAYDLKSKNMEKLIPISPVILPGLSLFYLLSRLGMGSGLLARKMGRVRIPQISPSA